MARTEPSSTASSSLSVLLVNPPSPAGVTANREGAGGLGAWSAGADGFLYPPHTLAHCAAVLRVRGWQARLLDAAGERLSVDAALARCAPAPAAIIAVHVAAISLDADIAFLNRLRALSPQGRLVAMGAGMALLAPRLLERTDVDHVLNGEPEAMLPALCLATSTVSAAERLRRVLSAADVSSDGMDRDGRVLDLDSLPHPAWDLAPLQRYGFLTVFGSRGCGDTCAYCPYALGQGRMLRVRHPSAVVAELRWLAATHRPARVIMRDPVFAAQRERVEQICRGLIDNNVRLAWECESRPEHFDRDLLRLMQRAGCTAVKIGLETTSESTLRAMRRIGPQGSAQDYAARTAEVAAICRAVGIACRVFVMTGLPGQTDGDVTETIRFLERMRPGAVHVKPFYRYAGLPVAGGEVAEEQQRGERQAALIQAAAEHMVPPASAPLWRQARRWLRQRLPR